MTRFLHGVRRGITRLATPNNQHEAATHAATRHAPGNKGLGGKALGDYPFPPMLTQSDGVAAVTSSLSAAERARNHRRTPVRRLRLALALFAIGVGAAVILQASWRSVASSKVQTRAASAPLILDKPRFTGVLKDGARS